MFQINPNAMKVVSCDRLEQMIETASLLRRRVHEIDGNDTTILTYIADVDRAAAFARRQSVLPAIAVVDWDGASSPTMNAWLKNNSDLNVQPYGSHSGMFAHNFCLSGHSWRGPLASHLRNADMRLKGCGEATMIESELYSYLSDWWHRSGWPKHIDQRMDEIRMIYNALADNASKAVFAGVIRSLQTGDPGHIPVSSYFHYFNPAAGFYEGDTVFEGGAADGQYTLEVVKKTGDSGKIFCFEPLRSYATRLKAKTTGISNITVEEFALSDKKAVCFLEDNGELSRIGSMPTPASQECRTIDIDSYVAEHGIPCNAIKLDIEGSELACLKGAARTIARFHPLLVISIYHHAADNFDIPLWIIDNFPGYELRMGHHSIWHHETVIYAKWPR